MGDTIVIFGDFFSSKHVGVNLSWFNTERHAKAT